MSDDRAATDRMRRREQAPVLVAVACSAGDPEAPSQMVSALPAVCGAAFLVVQTPFRGRVQPLAEVLAERTSLPVMYAHDGLVAERGHIYVFPPNTMPTLMRGCIRLLPVASGPDHSADSLFTSLAQELGVSAVGVILSGGGSYGALGIRAIRQGAGTTVAQYPGSARFPGMPISAIETGCVDFVLCPNEIARELTRISRHAVVPDWRASPMICDSADPAQLITLHAGS